MQSRTDRPGSWPVLMLALTVLWTAGAQAHDLGLGRVQLTWSASGELTVDATLPSLVSGVSGVSDAAPVLPGRCVPIESVERPGAGALVLMSWRYRCGPEPFDAEDKLSVGWPIEGLFVIGSGPAAAPEGAFFDPDGDGFDVPLAAVFRADDTAPGSFAGYFGFGVAHILGGWDHLAFVAALCLVASGLQLLKLVTAFTLGHSLTLALAALGWLSVPGLPLEASIALSVAFVAREAVVRPESGHGALVVVAFGLLHGIGFAGALSEAGMPAAGLVSALLGFNLGVETGQLIFVGVVLVALSLLAGRHEPAVRLAVAWGLGTLGAFWTLERTAMMLL